MTERKETAPPDTLLLCEYTYIIYAYYQDDA